jgi:hypothetical protein
VFEGTLIAESLRAGTTLDSVPLTVRKIVRHRPAYTTDDQPPIWTNIEFEVADDDADALASTLSVVLDRPGWYTDFRSADRIYVVFPGRVFSYLRGPA